MRKCWIVLRCCFVLWCGDVVQGAAMGMVQAQQLPEACVTVFGFAGQDSSKIIAMFHKHGYILRFHGAFRVVLSAVHKCGSGAAEQLDAPAVRGRAPGQARA